MCSYSKMKRNYARWFIDIANKLKAFDLYIYRHFSDAETKILRFSVLDLVTRISEKIRRMSLSKP